MLSSAHILAMDAKNLLDVIDSIRINYPGVDQVIMMMIRSLVANEDNDWQVLSSRSRSSVSTSSGSASASSSAASSLEKHRPGAQGSMPSNSPLVASHALHSRPSIS